MSKTLQRITLLLIALNLILSFTAFGLRDQTSGFCGEEEENNRIKMATLGGFRDSHSLAKFAVDEHYKKENAMIELARVVKAQEQVVAGTLYHLTLEVIDGGKKKLNEAKVWVKPWMNFKELQEFRHVEDAPAFTSSDLGVKSNALDSNQCLVHDPDVQEIVHANAEVIEDSTKPHMLIKTSRVGKQEMFKVQVHHTNEGAFHLNHMEPDHCQLLN